MRQVDFRSDTITKPTEAMRRAMYEAEVGDDVYGEDPTINQLEALAAEKVGKEAALFVPTGTMGNQLALMAHTKRGQEVILEDWSHIYRFEVGGLAFLSGLQAKPVLGHKGTMTLEKVQAAITKDEDIHHAQTGLICMENTHNMAGGVVMPLDTMASIYQLAQDYKIPVHLDGARLFNASIHLKESAKHITQYTDSVMFCLSKGLCAPVGSILAGDKAFIQRARRYRKMLGGGMRQAGVLAAAGIIALETMTERLQEDHDHAKILARGLSTIKGITIDMDYVHTNILMINIEGTGYKAGALVKRMRKVGILTSEITDNIIRFVTHKYITSDDIQYTINKIENLLK